MNVKKLRPEKYLRYLYPPNLFANKQRTKEILSANPTLIPHREEAKEVSVTVFDFDTEHLEEKKLTSIEGCLHYKSSGRTTWINIDGLRKADVESVCLHYDIHPLLVKFFCFAAKLTLGPQ